MALLGTPIYLLTCSVLLSFITFTLDVTFSPDGGEGWPIPTGTHRWSQGPLEPWFEPFADDTSPYKSRHVLHWLVADALFAAALAVFVLLKLRGFGLTMAERRAHELGAQRVPRNAQDLEQRQLFNIVEEMSLASGIPAPAVYTWGENAGINAFTAGHGIADASIFVSRGALALLNRDETQALLAHEFGHILNGDIALYGRLSSLNWLYSASFKFGRLLLRVPRHGMREYWIFTPLRWTFWLVYLPYAIVLTAAGSLQVLIMRLSQAGIVRHRERLADAHALQITRNPEGIKGVLMKIAVYGGLPGSEPATYADFEHSCFAAVTPRRWFDSHPGIEERLRAADPRYHPQELADFRARALSREKLRAIAERNAEAARRARELQQKLVRRVAGVGGLGAPVVEAALAEQAAPPWDVGDDAASPAGHPAPAKLLALLLDSNEKVRLVQLAQIKARLGDIMAFVAGAEYTEAAALDAPRKSEQLERLLPSMRQASPSEQRALLDVMRALQGLGGRLDVFEYCLGRSAFVFLQDLLEHRTSHGGLVLTDCAPAIQVILSVLAQVGHADQEGAAAAYTRGRVRLGMELKLPFQPLQSWAIALDRALGKLDRLQPVEKQKLLAAMSAVVRGDGVETLDEEELLRVIAASLHVPVGRRRGDWPA